MNFPFPDWYERFAAQYKAGNFCQFLFDGNINDKFFWPSKWDDSSKGSLYTFRRFLFKRLLSAVSLILYYSVTTGIKVIKSQDAPVPESRDIKEIGDNINLPSRARSYNTDRILAELQALEEHLLTKWTQKGEEGQNKQVYVAIVIDYFDRLVREPESIYERHIAELIEKWGKSEILRNLKNISILLTENRDFLPSSFRTDANGTYPIRVDYPDAEYRRLYFDWVSSQKLKPISDFLKDDKFIQQVVNLTKGFRIIDCEKIVSICSKANEKPEIRKQFFLNAESDRNQIRQDDVLEFIKREKKGVIESISRGMLIPVEANITFEEIGGLDGVKEYFRKVADAIAKSVDNPVYTEVIPKGVLLAGPPGTGKTLIAKALAKESGISLVRMGDIRSMWVGESEKNMSLVLNLLRVMSPVIVFIDEIDQAIGGRAQSSGDSGVSGRIFGKILEFMGDNENRGKVIWIAATNRADLLDDAMIRRFDRIIPVLLPGSEQEWRSVIRGIFTQILKNTNQSLSVEDEVIEQFVRKYLNQLKSKHSGSSIEVVLRKAYDNAILSNKGSIELEDLEKAFESFKTNFNWQVYLFQTLISISACNEVDFIKKPGEDYSYGDKDVDKMIQDCIEQKSNEPLMDKIKELRLRLQSVL